MTSPRTAGRAGGLQVDTAALESAAGILEATEAPSPTGPPRWAPVRTPECPATRSATSPRTPRSGPAPDGPVLDTAILLLLLTFLGYFLLPLPVPGFIEPRWYAGARRRRERGVRG